MEKRLVFTIALCAFIIIGWLLVQKTFFPSPPMAPPRGELQPPSSPADKVAPPPTTAPAAGTTGATPGTAAGPDLEIGAAAPRPPEELTTIERPNLYKAVFTTWGAAPKEFTLLNKQYKVTVENKDETVTFWRSVRNFFFGTTGGREEQINLVRPEASGLPYLTSFTTVGEAGDRSDFSLPPETAWTLAEKNNPDVLVYTADVGRVHVEKTWTLPKDGYALDLRVTVENRGDKPVAGRMMVAVNGYQDLSVKQGGLLSFGRRVNLTQGECDLYKKSLLHETEVKRVTRASAGGCGGGEGGPPWSERVSESGDVRWVAVADQYFLVAAALGPSAETRSCLVEGSGGGGIVARAFYPRQVMAPGAKLTYSMAAYAGPKLLHQLEAVSVDGKPARLGDAVNYGWVLSEWVARPLLAVLRTIYRVVGNWGVAIIFITIFLKLLTLYPTQKSMQSMKQMAKLKPKIDAIKAKFPGDQTRQNSETMALYKTHGVNPLGSCLPMLLQMPIYIGFYSMLSNAVELYGASFMGPIRDMTAPFPALALATGALMFLQQRTQPSTGDPQQQKMMMYMPLVFMAMTVFLPSGLTLYILTNTLLTMLHQYWMNRNDPDRKKPPIQGPGQGKSTLKPART